MHPFEDRSDVFVEVVEVCDELNETQVDKRIPTTHDTAIDLLFSNCAR